jgi:HK97 family phage major capsid protein
MSSKRKWTADERDRLSAGDITGAFAGPDQSYPIAGPSDVKDAWGLAGHADNPDKVRRRIISIAKKHGWLSGLPAAAKEWAAEHGVSLSPKAIGEALEVKGYKGEDDRWLVVENHIVLFGDEDKRDLVDEWFSDETDLESDYTKAVGRLALDFEHGLKVDGEKSPGRDDILGYTDWETAKKTEHGWLVQSMLDRRNKYVEAFEPLINERMIGTSSEAAPDDVRIDDDGHIRRWPLKRNSLTVEPAEPGMLSGNALTAYKSLQSMLPNLPELEPKDGEDTMAADEPGGDNDSGKSTLEFEGELTMGDEKNTKEPGGDLVTLEQYKSMQNDLSALSDQVSQLVGMMAKSPAAKGKVIAPDSETDHPEVKGFADFLYSVMVGNNKRLQTVYKAAYDRDAFKDMSGDVGTTGGVLVPEEYVQQILQVSEFQSGIMQRVRTIPTSRASGTWPALDQYFSPTAGSGQTAFAAGVTLDTIEAGGTYGESTPSLTQLKWRLNKVGRFVDVEDELMDDSPFAIETLLTTLFGIALASKNERNVLRGTGAGEPLGILNWGGIVARVPATDNTFAAADAGVMISTHKAVTNNTVWIVHPGILPDLYAMVSSPVAYLNNYRDAPDGTLYGYPVLRSEHLPQANASGCVVLADLGAYCFWQKTSGLAVAYSEHVNFKTGMGCWRFSHRNDGKPWFKDKIELADPGGSFYVSPFGYLND